MKNQLVLVAKTAANQETTKLCAFARGGGRTGGVGGEGSAAAARGADTPPATGAPVPGQPAAAAEAAGTAALSS